eukprot:206004_1
MAADDFVEAESPFPGWRKIGSRKHPGSFFWLQESTGRTQWHPPAADDRENQASHFNLNKAHVARPSTAPTKPSKHRIRQLQNSGASPIRGGPLFDPITVGVLEKAQALNDKFASSSVCSICCGEDPECICTICNCGNHRCPQHWHHVPYPNIKTEYQKKYPEWPLDDNRFRRRP